MRDCHQHSNGVTTSSIPIANSIDSEGAAINTAAINRAKPPSITSNVNALTVAPCVSIRGIIHQKFKPNPHSNPER